MPFHLEKGPIFSALEAMYNDRSDPTRLHRFLHALWRGKPLGQHGVITSPSADNPDPNAAGTPNATGPDRLAAMLRDWFGEINGTQPGFLDPHPEHAGPTFTTGYWSHFHGDVRKIVTETLMRAGEVALGVDRPVPVPETLPVGSRRWPVEFFWKCGQPRFEGWVTWRDDAQGRTGQVTVVFATPATPDQVYLRPARGADAVGAGAWDKWQGMWVCSHQNHRQYVMLTTLPTPEGMWLVPKTQVMLTVGIGDVGTWAPRHGNGGPAPQPVSLELGTAGG